MKYVLFALLAWVLYQFIFKLVIPVYRTTRKIKKGFREMQEKMNDQYRQQQQQQQGYAGSETAPKAGTSKTSKGDYIDFEEIK
jgi:hypothetical protein